MREAVNAEVSTDLSALTPVKQCYGSKPGCFRTDKTRLCDSLFLPIPPGLDPEDQIPDVRIWEDGVEMESAYDNGKNEFTFIIEEDGEGGPRVPDVILYNGQFYVIGEVHTVVDPYLEIDPEVIWIYPDWAAENDVYSNTRWNVK